MVTTRQLVVRDGDILLLIGTMKGLFMMCSNAERRTWRLGGPHFPGQSIYALAFDDRRDQRRVWAGVQSMHWGPNLVASNDFGRTWSSLESHRVKFPSDAGASLKQIWQIVPGPSTAPDRLYCGVEPAALFESNDAGENWSLVRGLHDHPHRSHWQPGGGGLCLHTILPDAGNENRIFVGISTGGVYRSDDGGRSWNPRNVGIRAEFLPERFPEFGQCIHKFVQHPTCPHRLYLQNHWGLYRSEDGGDHWEDIASGVPSDFGFAMAQHPRKADTVYIVPLESDTFRCTPEGKLRVYRTQDTGRSWEPLKQGLPQRHAMETVLRDALTTDPLAPTGVYFGTRSGQVFGSRDEGESWKSIMSGLPPVVCVKAARVA